MLLAAAGCSDNTSPRVLVSVSAPADLQQFDLFIKDEATREVLLHTGWSDATNGGKVQTSKAPLKIGLTLARPGSYAVAVVGAVGTTHAMPPYLDAGGHLYYDAQKLDVKGSATAAFALLEVPYAAPMNDDADGDLFPDATQWPKDQPAASAIAPELLDCKDSDDTVNPFASEICGDGIDQDCDGMDQPCQDADGDGDPDSSDCAPMDPKRHHPTKADPFPESANCCGYSLGKKGPDANKAFNDDPMCHAGTCDDGVDQDCDGVDAVCKLDGDCDTYGAGPPTMACSHPMNKPPDDNDCDDCDASINPIAAEVCGDGIDNNCNGIVDETCISCDLDGDGFQRMDMNGCPDAMYKQSGKPIDCDDEDAGVFPGSTTTTTKITGNQTCGGKEGGSVVCALRGACRNVAPSGMPQDADCDGAAYEGCPMANDADKDGFAMGADCNDADPTIFPGAPDKCGDGVAQNCVQDAQCTTDKDGDGYNAADDCDDGDAMVHPWAKELCNGKDDDCDGLVDEGNPDGAGNPLVANNQVTHCTDSNVGSCGKGKGDCVCSAVTLKMQTMIPNAFNEQMRTACPMETLAVDGTGASAPRCYFAPPPTTEVCDGVDNDCNGNVDNMNMSGGWDAVCASGSCCSPNCQNLQQDSNNCGACGNKCSSNAMLHTIGQCMNGMCGVGMCESGWACCSCTPMQLNMMGCTVDLNNDAANCGACGKACAKTANVMSVKCGGGSCSIGACNAGWADCDGIYANGCEVNVNSDPLNCSKCGMVCVPPMNATATCMAGVCGAACAMGFMPCGGACVNTMTDVNNCSKCGMVCSAMNGTPSCVAGKCGIASCNVGYALCGGMCISVTSDPNNCGGCGMKCPNALQGKVCVNGLCGCNMLSDCVANSSDGCTAKTCTCGVGAACDTTKANCSGGKCLLLNGQPCTLSSQCLSNNCHVHAGSLEC